MEVLGFNSLRSWSLEYMKVKHQLSSPCSVYHIQDGTVLCWDCNKNEGEFQVSGGIKLFPHGTGKDPHIGFSETEPSLVAPAHKDRRVQHHPRERAIFGLPYDIATMTRMVHTMHTKDRSCPIRGTAVTRGELFGICHCHLQNFRFLGCIWCPYRYREYEYFGLD